MCGIVGTATTAAGAGPDRAVIERMLAAIQHRGPDEFGIYADERSALGSARLSIIDLATGSQPICNESRDVWIVFNGEVFNYRELRRQLERSGHRFATASDTEVIVHLYEEHGRSCVERLNGQFAFAIWDRRPQSGGGTLLLARDRVGIRPLYIARSDGGLVFASEIKALLQHPGVRTRLDLRALAQAFVLWTTRPPRTPFEGILELPPGHTLLVDRAGNVSTERYWQLTFPGHEGGQVRTDAEWAEGLRDALLDATRIRLRADVPVGAYLSGGLDSSTIAALVKELDHGRLETFSIAFGDPRFDESGHQRRMASFLGTTHHTLDCSSTDVARAFPATVWHAEWPLLRTAPVPMFLLSELVRERGFKVVLTGEGADEFLGGYDIFKEDKIRRFWAAQPGSRLRPLLLRRLYPYLANVGRHQAFATAFFARRLGDTQRPEYSHLVRWENNVPLIALLSADARAALAGFDPIAEVAADLAAHPELMGWDPLARAQYVEASVFMSEYLLSSQGDRMLSAHSVEGRFPFLDHRVIEYASRIPARLKLRALDEKHVLKRAMRAALPAAVLARHKQPYRAPVDRLFFGPHAPAWVADAISPSALAEAGVFSVPAVARLARKAASAQPLGERDAMAVVAVLSTQLLVEQFLNDPSARCRPLPAGARMRLCSSESAAVEAR